MDRIRRTIWFATALLAATPAGAVEYKGIPVTLGILPKEMVQPLPIEITTDQFKARLKQGGTLVLDGNEMVLSPSDPLKKTVAFIALDRLELRHGAKIVTNGNVLAIFANTIASDGGSIVAFPVTSSKAASGAAVAGAGSNGNRGDTGLGAGVVSLHVIQGVEGQLRVELGGQTGGDGSDGQAGSPGPQGSHGTDAQDGPGGIFTPGWCKRGGGDGGPGGQGMPGGAAGSAGDGGDGGYFQLVNVGPAPLPAASFAFQAKGGGAGRTGQPGSGGAGGPGGSGGSGATYCGGGHGGPNGPVGATGSIPSAARAGADGNSLVKNLDLEVMIRIGVAKPVP